MSETETEKPLSKRAQAKLERIEDDLRASRRRKQVYSQATDILEMIMKLKGIEAGEGIVETLRALLMKAQK